MVYVTRIANLLAYISIFLSLPATSDITRAQDRSEQYQNECPSVHSLQRGGKVARNRFAETCRIVLTRDIVIEGPMIFEGAGASNISIDCNGARIGNRVAANSIGREAIIIRSSGTTTEEMASNRPSNLSFNGCQIRGHVRVYGMTETAGATSLIASSHLSGHTMRAQATAPNNIRFERVLFEAQGLIPLYVSPGVNDLTVANSTFSGRSNATSIYIDAETTRISIINSVFETAVTREHIAVDGSSNNKIKMNLFMNTEKGGVYVYRNCGERGLVRHQHPTNNIISNNLFWYSNFSNAPAVWLGSRSNRFVKSRAHCSEDIGYPFGSSIDDADHAEYNIVSGNKIVGPNIGGMIRDTGTSNVIEANTTLNLFDLTRRSDRARHGEGSDSAEVGSRHRPE